MSKTGRVASVVGTYFAGTILVIVGGFHILMAIAAFANDSIFVVVGEKYVFGNDLTTWAWIYLILGIALFLVGLLVYTGSAFMRTIAVILAVLSAFNQFIFLPYNPIWTVIVLALDVFIIWSLVAVRKSDLSGRED